MTPDVTQREPVLDEGALAATVGSVVGGMQNQIDQLTSALRLCQQRNTELLDRARKAEGAGERAQRLRAWWSDATPSVRSRVRMSMGAAAWEEFADIVNPTDKEQN